MKRILSIIIATLSLACCHATAAEVTSDQFKLISTAYANQMTIPVLYTCQGKDLSPQLEWAHAPTTTASFALIMSDSNAPGGPFYHWILYNLPKTTTSLPEGMTSAPTGAMLGTNDFNKAQYSGPCPPKGKLHTYTITLYALDSTLTLPAGADAKTVLTSITSHVIAKATITGLYTPWPPG